MNSFTKEYFAGRASGYNGYKLTYELELFFKKQISKIERLHVGRLKICDIGCAYGFFLKMCEEKGWTTYGADVSSHAISEAKKTVNAQLKVHDIQTGLAFPLERFDVITCFETVEHLKYPERAISHICQNLKDHGLLIVSTPNPRSYFYTGILCNLRDKDSTHISLKTPNKWRKLLEQNGFEISSFETTTYHKPTKRTIAKGWVVISKLLDLLGLGVRTEIVAIKAG